MKKAFKTLVLFLAVVLAAALFTGCTGSDDLVMATNAEFPPYEYKEGNEIIGIDVEIAQAIAKKLGKTLVI